jgi:hypothetical protein
MRTIPRATEARPNDERATAIGRAVLALLDALDIGASASTTYSATSLPPGISRDSFLRRHGARVREGLEGWTRTGQSRVVTSEAWAADVERETARARRRSTTVAPVPSNDVDDELDAALGIRTRRVAR